jgi:hypothetical protein
MDLEKENIALKEQLQELKEKLEALEKDNEELEDELEELKHTDSSSTTSELRLFVFNHPLDSELYEEVRTLRSEKSKLFKENELMSKDIQKINLLLTKERDSNQQLQQVMFVYRSLLTIVGTS